MPTASVMLIQRGVTLRTRIPGVGDEMSACIGAQVVRQRGSEPHQKFRVLYPWMDDYATGVLSKIMIE